jgi:hypothetical protein
MDQCDVYCVSTDKDARADIINCNDKRIKIVLKGTDITIILTREDTRSPYIGFAHGMEFETFGEIEQ